MCGNRQSTQVWKDYKVMWPFRPGSGKNTHTGITAWKTLYKHSQESNPVFLKRIHPTWDNSLVYSMVLFIHRVCNPSCMYIHTHTVSKVQRAGERHTWRCVCCTAWDQISPTQQTWRRSHMISCNESRPYLAHVFASGWHHWWRYCSFWWLDERKEGKTWQFHWHHFEGLKMN